MIPISLDNVRKEFGSTVAVDDVTLSIPAGDLFFLLGPSGCGKTTLLRMIAGFVEPTRGRIRLGDRDVTGFPPEKRNAGMVFQSYALWPHMTVADNVGFGLQVRKISKAERHERVEEALRTVQMAEYGHRKPNELSGGQQQRVALARALVIRPSVLLLDEPLSNLDAKLRMEMRLEIRRICKETGITTVYVTHDQKEALSMADGVAVMREGRVIQVGPPKAIYDRPNNRFVADFLGETNFLSAEVSDAENGHIRLESSAGALESSGLREDIPRRGNVTCSIRPEAWVIQTTNGDSSVESTQLSDGEGTGDSSTRSQIELKSTSANHWVGRVLSSVYLGEMAQHEIELPGETTVKAFELNPRMLRAGQTISVSVDPSDVVVLED